MVHHAEELEKGKAQEPKLLLHQLDPRALRCRQKLTEPQEGLEEAVSVPKSTSLLELLVSREVL